MKLTTFILISTLLHVNAAGLAQKITLKADHAKLEKVLQLIKKQTNIDFLFDVEVMKSAKRVDLTLKNVSLEYALKSCFAGQDLDYVIHDKSVVVSSKIPSFFDRISALIRELDVSGKVMDASGQPLYGATVKIAQNNKLVKTDDRGQFFLVGVNDDATIEISYVGYLTQVIKVSKTMNIYLSEVVKDLSEVVINKGYYTESQKLSTGSTVTIMAKDIENQPVTNVLLAIQGRVAGLQITQNTGVANGSVNILIRGRSSLNTTITNDPLYVIDGVPYPSQLLVDFQGNSGSGNTLASPGGNPLNYISPSNIERIDILKDADATAIYGSRGGNGVILITTKKGKAGQLELGLNATHGMMLAPTPLHLMNTEQYLAMRREAFINDGIAVPSIVNPGQANDVNYDVNGTWQTTDYTDWQNELIGKYAGYTNLNLSLSGGNPNVKYAVRGILNRQSSLFPGNFKDIKSGVNFVVNGASNNQQFKFDFSGSYLKDDNQNSGSDLSAATLRAPNAPASFNADGVINYGGVNDDNANNPYALTLRTYTNNTENLVMSFRPSMKIIDGLILSANLGLTKIDAKIKNITPAASYAPTLMGLATLYETTNQQKTWIAEPQLTYDRTINKFKVSALIGSTFQRSNYNGNYLIGYNFVSDALMGNIVNAGAFVASDSGTSDYKYNAVFGRVNANWDDRYLLNLTGRRDGSSKFGPEKQFANFYSIGAAWIFSNESSIKNRLSFFSLGKLRASFGTSGNDGIQNYQYYDIYSKRPGTYQTATGFAPSRIANPDVAWEQSAKLEVAMELGFFKDRIVASGAYYRNRSSNQLLSLPLPAFTGFSSIPAYNFPATVENSGYEFTLNTTNIQGKDFQWTTSFNISANSNKLIRFDNLSTSSYATSLEIGQPVIGRTRVYQYAGIDPTTGIYTFQKLDGTAGSVTGFSAPSSTDAVFNSYILNLVPKYFGGLNNSFGYKNFHLDVFFQFIKQRGKQSLTSQFAPGLFSGSTSNALAISSNVSTVLLDRWQKPGDGARFQKFTQTAAGNQAQSAFYNSDAAYVDASFIRLKNLSFSYQLPSKLTERLKLKGCSITIQAQNLFTITSYEGRDPETQAFGTLPPLKVIAAGVQINL